MQDKINNLPAPSLRDQDEKEKFQEYETELETCQSELDITIKAMWDLPGLLMDEGAEVQWQQTVAKYCETVPYLAPGGKSDNGESMGKVGKSGGCEVRHSTLHGRQVRFSRELGRTDSPLPCLGPQASCEGGTQASL